VVKNQEIYFERHSCSVQFSQLSSIFFESDRVAVNHRDSTQQQYIQFGFSLLACNSLHNLKSKSGSHLHRLRDASS